MSTFINCEVYDEEKTRSFFSNQYENEITGSRELINLQKLLVEKLKKRMELKSSYCEIYLGRLTYLLL